MRWCVSVNEKRRHVAARKAVWRRGIHVAGFFYRLQVVPDDGSKPFTITKKCCYHINRPRICILVAIYAKSC